MTALSVRDRRNVHVVSFRSYKPNSWQRQLD